MASIWIVLPVLALFITGEAMRATPIRDLPEEKKTWCVAKPSATEEELSSIITFVCNAVGERCQVVNDGGACYSPANLWNHASVLMNIYYQSMQRHYWNCFFKGSGLISLTNPSYGTCIYD